MNHKFKRKKNFTQIKFNFLCKKLIFIIEQSLETEYQKSSNHYSIGSKSSKLHFKVFVIRFFCKPFRINLSYFSIQSIHSKFLNRVFFTICSQIDY